MSLPAFLTEPIACPPGRCYVPHTPLHPITPELAALLPRVFLDLCELEFRTVTTRATQAQDDFQNQKVLKIIKMCPPKMARVASEVVMKSEGTGGEKSVPSQRIKDVGVAVQDTFDAALSRFSQQAMPVFAREVNRLPLCCLHDVLDPSRIEDWRRIARRVRPPQLTPSDWELGPQPLFRIISAAIAKGEVDASSWGGRKEWESDAVLLKRELHKAARGGLFGGPAKIIRFLRLSQRAATPGSSRRHSLHHHLRRPIQIRLLRFIHFQVARIRSTPPILPIPARYPNLHPRLYSSPQYLLAIA